MKGNVIAKLKFWFGASIKDLFNEEKYIIEHQDLYIYVYEKV